MVRLWNVVVAAAVTTTGFVPTWVWGQGTPGPEQFGYGHHMWGLGMMLGPLFFILVLVLVIVVAVVLVRWLAGPSQGAAPHQVSTRTPLDILKERFARGEIDKDEFEERRRVLGD